MHPSDRGEFPALNEQTQAIWDQNAAWWDQQVGDGNVFQNQLLGRATERSLAVRAGESVLDLACGNGLVSRRLAQLGAQVTACDFSASFLERPGTRHSPTGSSTGWSMRRTSNSFWPWVRSGSTPSSATWP